jgi:hypothetical protein
MTPSPTRRGTATMWALSLLLGACSLPTDEDVTPIDADGLPPEIANTTTTSTTTTTTTTVPAPTSVPPETTAPTTPPAPTTAPPFTTPVDIFYADRATDGMQRLRRLLLEPLSLQSVISQLELPPADLSSYGVRSALEPGLIGDNFSLDRSVLTVSLNSAVFDSMNEEQKRQAIAQMVLTFTSFAVPGAGNIGSVILQVDGTPIAVYIPAEGTTREAGNQVFYDDFSNLVVGTGSAPTTTSVPPDESVPPTQTTLPPTGPGQ